jgi:hypothetical protein
MDILYFGNLKSNFNLNCTIINLLLNNVIELDGTINLKKLDVCLKRQLWAYIIYLARSNPGIEPFVRMDGDNPRQLIEVVTNTLGSELQYEYFLKKDLANFINKFLTSSSRDLIDIKIISQVLDRLLEKVNDMEKDLVRKIKIASEEKP